MAYHFGWSFAIVWVVSSASLCPKCRLATKFTLLPGTWVLSLCRYSVADIAVFLFVFFAAVIYMSPLIATILLNLVGYIVAAGSLFQI
jgi:hypothetical protein